MYSKDGAILFISGMLQTGHFVIFLTSLGVLVGGCTLAVRPCPGARTRRAGLCAWCPCQKRPIGLFSTCYVGLARRFRRRGRNRWAKCFFYPPTPFHLSRSVGITGCYGQGAGVSAAPEPQCPGEYQPLLDLLFLHRPHVLPSGRIGDVEAF